ncbi:uncharacterized protein LOC119832656 isoform X1 [Zerene cesonia]|uniref:uncharacterized protein LOC119832656 isoform X1 n=1 Tax=Zerene cesonia TaxID=33412 RepID=UPI0018E57E4A|nr:uncharacterized protein LOC119832656 isoform X1 [Zerene cesonia]
MLQSLLQPSSQRTKCTAKKMIGAMPAVAVRHERRRAEKRGGGGRRPSQLPLQLGRGLEEATPSPDHRFRHELYFCRKTAFLHAVVGSLLLGIVVLVVGLVQLSPGAEAAQHRYYLMGAGAALIGAGILGAVLRCVCIHWYNRKYRSDYHVPATHAAPKHVSVVDSQEYRPKLKTQASVGREVDLIKQPSAASDT